MATSPSSSFATLRPDLAGSLQKFDLEANIQGYVGLQLAPVIEVDQAFGNFGKIEIKDLLQERASERQSDGGYNRGSARGGKDTYSCDEHGFEEPVDDREAVMYGGWWDAEQLAAQRARDVVLANHTKRVITLALAISNTQAASAVWTGSSGTPIADVAAAKIAIRGRCGERANAMIIEYEPALSLRLNPQLQDAAWGSVNPKRELSNEDLARVFELDEVIISGGLKNTANPGQTAPVLTALWTKTKALVFVKRTDRNIKRPRFMQTFHWGADGSQIGGVMESYRDEAKRSDIVRHRMDTDEKVMMTECGQIITAVAA